MEVTKMDGSDEEIRLEVKGEGHTFCNALQNFLLKDPVIEFSGYNITHPLVGEPILNIRTGQYYGYQWNLMAAARAATNQIWMIACNSVGEQHKGKYDFWGGSGLWAPSGIPLFQASNKEEQLCLLHQINIQHEVEAEHDAFDFYDSFRKVYRCVPKMRAFTRMEDMTPGSDGK